MVVKSYRDLIVWQKSISLVKSVYTLTSCFPREELYGLTSQVRRSAVSVPSNIAEGCGRGTTKDYIYFLRISFGSLYELQTQLVIAGELEYVSDEMVGPILALSDEIEKMIAVLIKKLESKVDKNN